VRQSFHKRSNERKVSHPGANSIPLILNYFLGLSGDGKDRCKRLGWFAPLKISLIQFARSQAYVSIPAGYPAHHRIIAPRRNPSPEERERRLIGSEVATFSAGSIPCGEVSRVIRRETSPSCVGPCQGAAAPTSINHDNPRGRRRRSGANQGGGKSGGRLCETVAAGGIYASPGLRR
jgi:hypothetical protein